MAVDVAGRSTDAPSPVPSRPWTWVGVNLALALVFVGLRPVDPSAVPWIRN